MAPCAGAAATDRYALGTMSERISIGFHASPPLAARVDEKQLKLLREALNGKDAWFELDSEDGHVTLKLEHVLWIRSEKDEQRVGFGIGS